MTDEEKRLAEEERRRRLARTLQQREAESSPDLSIYDKLAIGGYLGTMPKYETLKKMKGK